MAEPLAAGDPFDALGDPNRRAIVELLGEGEHSVQELADALPISRPAVSRHVKILAECGLVVVHQRGRERYCEARLEKLNEVSDWVEQYQKIWEQRFDRLDEYLNELHKKEKNHGEK